MSHPLYLPGKTKENLYVNLWNSRSTSACACFAYRSTLQLMKRDRTKPDLKSIKIPLSMLGRLLGSLIPTTDMICGYQRRHTPPLKSKNDCLQNISDCYNFDHFLPVLSGEPPALLVTRDARPCDVKWDKESRKTVTTCLAGYWAGLSWLRRSEGLRSDVNSLMLRDMYIHPDTRHTVTGVSIDISELKDVMETRGDLE